MIAGGHDANRELWAPEIQAAPADAVRRAADAGIAREWQRVWEEPIEFYRERYAAAGLGAGAVPPLDEIPLTRKADLRADERAHPPFGRHRGVSLDQALRLGSSTGTTGTPTLIFYGPRDLEAHVESGTRNLWRHGLRSGQRFTHAWPQGLYPTGVSGGETYLRAGLLEIAVGPPFDRATAHDHLRFWSLLEPDGFMLTSSQLQLYEDVAREHGIDLIALLEGARVGFLEASCQFEAPRRRMEEIYGFALRNIGGASEVPGFAVSDCRHHRGLHARGDLLHLQACDPATGREVPEGERGTLVVSCFGIDTFFLRYDLQDIVTVTTEPCPCGETGPRYTLLGRGADAVEVDGRTILPIDVQLAAFDALDGHELQMVPDSTSSVLRLRVEADAPRCAAVVTEALGVPVEAEEVPEGTLPRSPFKPRRVAT